MVMLFKIEIQIKSVLKASFKKCDFPKHLRESLSLITEKGFGEKSRRRHLSSFSCFIRSTEKPVEAVVPNYKQLLLKGDRVCASHIGFINHFRNRQPGVEAGDC